MPAAASGSRQWFTWRDDTMNGSLTTSGRDRPNLASTSAIWRTAPPPICSMRGAAKLALTAVMAWFSYPRKLHQNGSVSQSIELDIT